MSHFTEGVLQAYLDNEVAADTRAQVAAHVSGCIACAARLQELRELATAFTAALQSVDVAPIPAGALAELRMLRARPRPLSSRWAASRTALLRAAMLVLGITAVAAATVPGSPLRGWLAKVWSSVTADEVAAPAIINQEAPAAPAEEPTLTWIAPEEGRIRVLLQSLATGTRVHVVLVDEDRAAVQATGKFRTAAGLLEVTGGSGDIRISLPRAVGAASVEVDGRLYVTKEGGDLRFLGPSADTVGAELIFRPGR